MQLNESNFQILVQESIMSFDELQNKEWWMNKPFLIHKTKGIYATIPIFMVKILVQNWIKSHINHNRFLEAITNDADIPLDFLQTLVKQKSGKKIILRYYCSPKLLNSLVRDIWCDI